MICKHRTARASLVRRGTSLGLMALAAMVIVQPRSSARAVAPAENNAAAPSVATAVPLPYTFRDGQGTQWDVQQDGSVGPGDADVFDAGGRLFVGGAQPYAPNAQQAELDAARNEVILPPQPIAGLNVSRRVGVNVKGGWCRWVEVLENPTGAPIKTQVHVNFDLGGQNQTSQNVNDPKTGKPIGVAIFDGNRGIASLGGGAGAKVAPTYGLQPNTDQVDLTWDVEVPPHKTAAIVHLEAVRPTANVAETFLQKIDEKQVLQTLPPEVLKAVVNFASHTTSFANLELLRGGLLDVVELRGGDQYKGTLQETRFALQTPYGPVDLPAERVLGMLTIGEFRPMQLVVTREGEAFGGVLQSPVVHLQLSSGQITPIPLHTITRLGYRKRPGDPADEFKYARAMLMLRNGDRIAIETPSDPLPVATRYGSLLLRPDAIGAVAFQADDDAAQSVHEITLTDGSRFAGVVAADVLELKPLTIGTGGKPLRFPTGSIARLQVTHKVDEPDEQSAPVLSLATGDRFVGGLTGSLSLETAFDTIQINGAEIRALHRIGAAPGEVQVTLWDDATLSGRFKGDALEVALRSGPTLRVPVPLIDQYRQPQPQPPASVLQNVRALVAQLASDDWKRADRAAAALADMGPKVSSVLKGLRGGQVAVAQGRIDKILAGFEVKNEPPPAPKPVEEAGPAENAPGR